MNFARAAGCLLALALVVGGGVARAQQDSLEAQKRRELEALSQQAKEKRAQAGALKGQETRALGELKRTERELTATRKRLKTLGARRARIDDQLELTRANLERSVATLTSKRQQLAHRLRHIYMEGPARDLEFLVSTKSFAGLMMRWDFLQMVAEQDRLLLESVETERDKVEANKKRLESNLQEVSANAQMTTKQSTKLANLRESRANTVEEIQSKREEYEAAAAELERGARALQALLARLERERKSEEDRARSEGRNPQPYSGDFARGRGQLDWPVRGNVIGHFGLETHPRFGTQVRNDGIDIDVPVGTAVHAVAKGRVDAADEDYEGVGGLIVLNHGDGYYTIYSHLSEIDVTSGSEVQSGAVIGKSGEEGSLKGPVLHFEVRKGAAALDPAGWLR